MATAQLDPKAAAVCAKNYGSVGSGCGRCPIYAACTSGCTPLTRETLAAWQQRVADAAAKVRL